jgi:hypothetical protein
MWNEQKRLLDAQLSPGEQLLWWGEPRRGIVFRAADAYMIPFSILWTAFAVFWETGVLSSDAPILFKFWGVPFILVGLYMVVGRFFVEARVRAKTYYGVTNERILILSGLFTQTTKSLGLRTLTDVTLDERSDRSGTISFGPPTQLGWWESSFNRTSQQPPPSFVLIPDAKKVYEIIMNAQRQRAV